ncbi:MAG: TIGR01212 family radical SAM protein [Ruminococcaceae bacterium]|nr:TIGR01212 family radical SAM protein [Oscillospiraceae bacterium]
MPHNYLSVNTYCRRIFGCKVYKIALSAANTCPNRDGTVGVGGCSFCSAGGSGDFAAPAQLNVEEQITRAKSILGKKGDGLKYIAYFQSYTGTHGDICRLYSIYKRAIEQPDVVGISIATRPDCLGEEALLMIKRLYNIKPVWIELGLQTIHDKTAQLINRCYPLNAYEKAMEDLAKLGVHRITHVILGLPGENRAEMLETVKFAAEKSDGIKLQLLHVISGTKLAESYNNGEFEVLKPNEYYELIADALSLIPEDVVIHRLTGDGAKKDLIAPLWSADKKRVLADLNRTLRKRGIYPQKA